MEYLDLYPTKHVQNLYAKNCKKVNQRSKQMQIHTAFIALKTQHSKGINSPHFDV